MTFDMNRPGMILISGCPRSGTSVTMDIQRAAHGDDLILGHKFPQEQRQEMLKEARQRLEDETDSDYSLRLYLMDKQIALQEIQKRDELKYQDMNPEGFWEMEFSVQGIIYRHRWKRLFAKLLAGEEYRICKVVSQGLLNSDPIYISKIIYLIRHPRAVAKSQERLLRGFNWTDEDGTVRNAFEDMKIHTPEMFITVTVQACRFFIDNPEIPVKFFHFEKIMEDPINQINAMGEFVGCGDYTKAHDIVQQKLNRSKHEDVDSNLWEDAYFVYDKLCKGADLINEGKVQEAHEFFKEVLTYMEDPKREINREHRRWMCYRAKKVVCERECVLCMTNVTVRENFKSYAEKTNHPVANHWSEEPCPFECGMDLDRDNYLTLDESIENNFWNYYD